MKIAFVTDDSKTISAHFGRAQYYEVITIMDNKSTVRETRPKANHSHFANEIMDVHMGRDMEPIPHPNTAIN